MHKASRPVINPPQVTPGWRGAAGGVIKTTPELQKKRWSPGRHALQSIAGHLTPPRARVLTATLQKHSDGINVRLTENVDAHSNTCDLDVVERRQRIVLSGFITTSTNVPPGKLIP